MSPFKELRIVNNFYQTSAFFPMPTIAVGTLDEDGMTSLGAYSLCFPYYIAGKDYYAMLLECRNNSNTAQNLLRTGKCSLNFIEDSRKTFKELVRLGFPGEHSKEKQSVVYAAGRMDPDVQFTKEACQMLVKVPRVFLKLVLKGCVDYAKENGIAVIDEQTMKIINDKRSKEKGK